MKQSPLFVCAVALLVGAAQVAATPKPQLPLVGSDAESREKADAKVDAQPRATAVFAGGCFWCMEPPFDRLQGVVETISGYTGGHIKDPSYKQVSAGDTGHYEAVKIVYDPTVVSYEQLLPVFWSNIDPFDSDGQFCDKGQPYRSAIFTLNRQQQQAAERSLEHLREKVRAHGEFATKILPASEFYAAEEYHQNYYQKNPLRYRFYRARCGRDERLESLWGEIP